MIASFVKTARIFVDEGKSPASCTNFLIQLRRLAKLSSYSRELNSTVSKIYEFHTLASCLFRTFVVGRHFDLRKSFKFIYSIMHNIWDA